MNKILTIITINYNNLEGLKKTFDSIFNQTFQDFEYIVIDGGSTDGSKDYIEANQDKIDYWISEKDNGVYHAMNKGILKSSGKYLNFMNSGDLFFNKLILELTINKFDSEKDLYYGDLIVEDNSKVIGHTTHAEKVNFIYFLNHCLPHQASFYKTELFQKNGLYDEKYKFISDWSFAFECIVLKKCTYEKINKFIAIYDNNGISSNINNADKIFQEKSNFLEENFKFTKSDFEDYNEIYFKSINLDKKRILQIIRISKSKFHFFILKLFSKIIYLTLPSKYKSLNY
jgi:glycosyltransferase involved in cell wall biosynthesis